MMTFPARSTGIAALAFLFAGVLVGCRSETSTTQTVPFEEQLRLQLETAKSGDIIQIPAGNYSFTRGLTLNTDGVTIRGAGMDASVLSFRDQIAGAEGLLVNASDFVIEDLAIEDAQGDGLKINEGENIVVRRVRTEWTNGPATDNGAYGIYPVQTSNTLIEGCVAIAASDAGIYVGQSRNVVVRNNRAEYNVAGIEIENTIYADVYNNVAINNTGGILVFNMPHIPQAGHSTRVYNNNVTGNNTANFAAPGTAVSGVPAGSGLVINSNDKVEVFHNVIADNQTANVLISSYFSANYAGQRELADNFDPYPEQIYVYDNQFSGGGTAPDRDDLQQLRESLFGADGTLPDIVWDGAINPAKLADGQLPTELTICIENGDAGMVNVDLLGEFKNVTTNMDAHRCAHPKLAPVQLTGALAAGG